MQVLGQRVFIKAVTKPGLLGGEEVDYYEVAFIGKDCEHVSVGDRVIPPLHAPSYEHEGVKYSVVDEEEVIAII